MRYLDWVLYWCGLVRWEKYNEWVCIAHQWKGHAEFWKERCDARDEVFLNRLPVQPQPETGRE